MLKYLFYLVKFILKLPIYKLRKNSFGKSPWIESGVFLSRTKIGNYNYLGHYSIITDARIGHFCSIASSVSIGGSEHDYTQASTSFRLFKPKPKSKKKTKIEDDVWIGTKATIKAGVTIGKGAVIGSHALVLSNVEPYEIVVGQPARVIKKRFDENKVKQLLKIEFDQGIEETQKTIEKAGF